MNKGLEALESIKFGCCNFEDRTLYGDEIKVIEKVFKNVPMHALSDKKANY